MSKDRKQQVPKVGKSGYKPQSNSSTMTYILFGVAIVVIAAVVIGGIVWSNNDGGEQVDESQLTNTALAIGEESAPVTIDVFEDFMCPACGQFEASQGQQILEAVNNKQRRVRYHMLNFLNRTSASGDYSTRAAAAFQCVADGGEKQDVIEKFHSTLFQNQPTEGGSTDHDNKQLAEFAADAGASSNTQACISSGARVKKAEENADAAQQTLAKATGGQVSTPSVLHDGKLVTLSDTWLTDLLK